MTRDTLTENVLKVAATNPELRALLVPVIKNAWDDDDQDEEVDEYDRAVAFLNGAATKLPKKTAWWIPDHNLAINFPLLRGFNLWYYTILPLFPAKKAYLPAGADPNGEPEGIVIHPGWHPFKNDYPEVRFDLAQKVLDFAKKAETVQAQTMQDFHWIESKFGIKIPSEIKTKYVSKAPDIAARRWAVDHLRIRDTFVPFDGRKPVDVPAFGRPRY